MTDRSRPTHLAIENLVRPSHPVIRRNIGRLDAWVVHGIRAQAHLLGRILPRHTRLVELLRLGPEVAQARLPVIQLRLTRERAAMTRKDGVEVEAFERRKRTRSRDRR